MPSACYAILAAQFRYKICTPLTKSISAGVPRVVDAATVAFTIVTSEMIIESKLTARVVLLLLLATMCMDVEALQNPNLKNGGRMVPA